jgi:hypothetical protein
LFDDTKSTNPDHSSPDYLETPTRDQSQMQVRLSCHRRGVKDLILQHLASEPTHFRRILTTSLGGARNAKYGQNPKYPMNVLMAKNGPAGNPIPDRPCGNMTDANITGMTAKKIKQRV